MRKRMLLAAMAAAAILVGGSGSAIAGERTGAGGPTPVNDGASRSECAFSGLEDFDFESAVQPGVVQNWGVIVAAAGGKLGGANSVQTPFGLTGCNAHDYPAK